MIPQPITVHGRTGTVVYMDNNWLPVPVARATMAKVVFDDGGVAFYTTPEPSKPEGLGGLTKKFDAALHPRGKDGKFIEASEPRIFNKPSDVKQYDSWGGEKLWGWVDPATGETTGRLLTGVPIPPEDMRATLFHVTTNAPAVEESGVLLGQVGDAGLGGGQAPGVSFTTSREDATVIQRELKRAVQIARGDLTTDAFTQWAREDEKSAGLPEGSLDYAVNQAMEGWNGNKFIMDKKYVQGQGYTDTPPEPEERERIRRSLMKDALNAYLWARETASEKAAGMPVPSLKNPILFGRQEHMAKVVPENIQILEVGSNMIPEGALVTTGSDKFLHEVRAYSDVPLWKKLQSVAKKEAAFDESKHPREPGGSSEGGQFAATGRVGSATSDPVLAEQAKTGIIAVEKLLPQAVKTARYDQTPEPKIWDEVDDSTQDAVRSAWEEEQYGNLDVDTRGLEDEVRAEVGRDNQGVLDKAFEDTIATLDHAKPFKDTDPTLPLTLSLHKTLDPDTIDYGAGDHEEAGWYPSGRKNHGGTVELDLDALRFTSGEELTLEQKNIVKEHWDAAYNENYLQAVEKVLESESYSERVSQLESEQISAEWNNLLDRDKLSFMIEHKLNVITTPGEPDRWTTGVKEGAHSDANYARTHAIALKLTELRMDELRKERGLLKPLPTELPTFTVHESRNHTESHPSYVAKNAAGEVVASSNTIAQVTQNAKDWATNQMTLSDDLSSKKIISEVWESWKVKSGEGLGLSLQLAAARELGGHHRMTPGEVEYAELDAKSVGGIETLQAYVRAQWEVTQMVMKKAGEDKIDVYRGLMLPGDVVRTTPREMFTPNAKPVAPPANVKALHRKEPGREKEEYVTFDYMGEHFVVEKEVVMVRPKEDIDPGETDVAEIETTEAAVQRRIAEYHESTQGRALAFIKLPALQLKRAGAQSTTGTADVANDWGGVGDLPPDPVRVVLRIEAPPTSVLSLPVYGENNQSEHESVLLGTRDRWLWDAWRDRAPLFKNITVTTGGQMAQKADTLVIDLQAEDRGKPHWMSSVDWSTVQSVAKFDPSQPRHPKGSEQGGEFAKTRQGARKAIMDVIEGPVGVDDHPVAIRAAHEVAAKLQEMKQRGYPMPHQVVVEAQQGRKAPGGEAWENGTIFLRVPDHLPPEMTMDEAMAIRSKPVEGDINPFTGKPHPPGLPKFVSQKFEDVVVHEMGHILRRPSIAAPYITNRSSPEDLAKSEASREQFSKEMAANKGFEAAANTVSQYAHSNPDEFVAEVFTILYHGGTLPPATLAVYDGLRGATVR